MEAQQKLQGPSCCSSWAQPRHGDTPAAGEGGVQPGGRWVGWRVTRGDSPGSGQAGHTCTFNMAPLLFKAFQYPPNKPMHFKAYTCFYVNI